MTNNKKVGVHPPTPQPPKIALPAPPTKKPPRCENTRGHGQPNLKNRADMHDPTPVVKTVKITPMDRVRVAHDLLTYIIEDDTDNVLLRSELEGMALALLKKAVVDL